MYLRGISPRLWRIYANIWLVSLAFPVSTLVQQHLAVIDLIVPTVSLTLFVIFYLWHMSPYPLQPAQGVGRNFYKPRQQIVVITTLILLLSLMYDSLFLWMMVGLSAVAGRILPTRSAHITVSVLPILVLFLGIILGGGLLTTDWLHIIPLAMLVRALGLDMIGLSLLSGTIQELQSAREELTHRAVNEERLRLARDLHDLLGRTLSLIVLKSELAGRLVEKQPVQASKEIGELETAARQALREVRQAVAGYRQPTLQGELDGARQLLIAAGIEITIQNSLESSSPSIETLIAWTVREGVTNVIRHSRAQHCLIRITVDRLLIRVEIIDDGLTYEDQVQLGSGLTGLSERAMAQGGRVKVSQWQADPFEGFRLCVELPCSEEIAREGQFS